MLTLLCVPRMWLIRHLCKDTKNSNVDTENVSFNVTIPCSILVDDCVVASSQRLSNGHSYRVSLVLTNVLKYTSLFWQS